MVKFLGTFIVALLFLASACFAFYCLVQWVEYDSLWWLLGALLIVSFWLASAIYSSHDQKKVEP